MNPSKSDWYLILFFLLAFVMVGLNELGYGLLSLILLFPASWLAAKGFGLEDHKKA
jgi:hypothetical protein